MYTCYQYCLWFKYSFIIQNGRMEKQMRLKSTEKVPVKTVIAIDVATTYGSVANVK